MFHGIHPVRKAHGPRPVGHQHHGLAAPFLANGPQNHRFIQAVQIACWLVQQQEGRIMQECTGQTQPLALAAGKGIAQFAYGVS